nr:retrotransposon protein, putative, Ty3-gypsy subclass [Tanacetum cinerariifolium]
MLSCHPEKLTPKGRRPREFHTTMSYQTFGSKKCSSRFRGKYQPYVTFSLLAIGFRDGRRRISSDYLGMEVFMDNFSVFGSSFNHCLKNLEKMLKRCEEINFVLNWEKCHFMVKEGIVLGQKISGSGIKLLVKDTPFNFSKECIQAVDKLKQELTRAPVMSKPDWSLPFEVMCDASDYSIGAVLGKRKDNHFQPIHYASKTMNEALENYTTTEKEILAVVFAFDKFWQYLVLSKLLSSQITLPYGISSQSKMQNRE